MSSDSDTGEDKIEQGAQREHKNAYEIARFYEDQFVEDLKALNMRMPDVMPRATEHIKEQIELVRALEERGFTYKIADGVYFDTSKLEDYGKLTGQKREDLKAGARVEENKEKKNPADFALWKFSNPEGANPKLDMGSKRQMEWESPWGVGFPGWHLECSAMSTKYLGQPFEIHTGGVDHIGVHHTNEIAQSEAAYGKPLASYWMHSDFLLQEGRKMAKSAGHFIRLQDIESKGYLPLDFRYLCLTAHYRKKLDFSWESLAAAHQSLKKLKQSAQASEEGDLDRDLADKFDKTMADDLNSPKAISEVFAALEKGSLRRKTFEYIDEVLALDLLKKAEIPEEVLKLADERDEFRKKGDYEKADELRKKILDLGFEVEDTADGPRVLTR
jgi:cysteinyl-tRNA synthetase